MMNNKSRQFIHASLFSFIILALLFSFMPVSAQGISTDTPTPTETTVPTDTDVPTDIPTETPIPEATATNALRAFQPGSFDDNHPYFRYIGWQARQASGMYASSEHYSAVPGNTVEFAFNGTGLTLHFRRFNTFGKLAVDLDGSEVVVLEQYADTDMRNEEWSVTELPDGYHTIRLTHLDGIYVEFDYIDIMGLPTETPTITETPQPSNTPTASNTPYPTRTPSPSSTPTNTSTPTVVGPGLYDDQDYRYTYTGWKYHAVSGLIANSEHYSSIIGSRASLLFNGVSVMLHYRKSNTFGSIRIWLDGIQQTTIAQYATTDTRNLTWVSPTLSTGIHTLVIEHISGTYAVFDAVTVNGAGTATNTATSTRTATPTRTRTFTPTASSTFTPSRTPSASYTPLPTKTFTPSRTPTATRTPSVIAVGKIDDSDARIYYDLWLKRSITGLYNNTEHYSATAGRTAYFLFRGTGITLNYRALSTFGTMSVAIDGVTVAEINEYSRVESRNLSWNSGPLPLATHSITLTHLTGQYVVIDAFTIDGPATDTPTPTNTFTPSLTSTSTRTRIPSYTFTPSKTSTATRTKTNTSTPTITRTPALIGLGVVDDNDTRIQYNGWLLHTINGMYNNTEHYSPVIGQTVAVRFMGEQVKLKFREASTFGKLDVSIDGENYTIDQYSPTAALNIEWASPVLSPGVHSMILTHATGTYTTLDSITILGTPTSTPTSAPTRTPTASRTPSPTSTPTITFTPSETPTPTNTPLPATIGTYDDNDYRISYAGWLYHPQTGMYLNTEHYSQTAGSTASFTFSGTGIQVNFRKFQSFGNVEVRIDGLLVATVNQYAASEVRNQSWVSNTLADGVHLLTLTHATGTTVVLDALIVR